MRPGPAPRMVAHQEGVGRAAPLRTTPTFGPVRSSAVSTRPAASSPGGAALRAPQQTCAPPAATQDTRGRSSARVPCCSPRSHTVSWRARPVGTCSASSSRWAAWLPLGESDLPCARTSKLENRGWLRDWTPRLGLDPWQPGKTNGLGEGQPGASPARGSVGAAWQVSPGPDGNAQGAYTHTAT